MLHCVLLHLEIAPCAHPAEAHRATTGHVTASAVRQLCVLRTAADKACVYQSSSSAGSNIDTGAEVVHFSTCWRSVKKQHERYGCANAPPQSDSRHHVIARHSQRYYRRVQRMSRTFQPILHFGSTERSLPGLGSRPSVSWAVALLDALHCCPHVAPTCLICPVIQAVEALEWHLLEDPFHPLKFYLSELSNLAESAPCLAEEVLHPDRVLGLTLHLASQALAEFSLRLYAVRGLPDVLSTW